MTDRDVLISETVDDATVYRLRELCELCEVNAEYIAEMVETGILIPEGSEPSSWRFSAHAVVRFQQAKRLQRDLDVNLPGIALALELLDELNGMRAKVRSLEHLVSRMCRD